MLPQPDLASGGANAQMAVPPIRTAEPAAQTNNRLDTRQSSTPATSPIPQKFITSPLLRRSLAEVASQAAKFYPESDSLRVRMATALDLLDNPPKPQTSARPWVDDFLQALNDFRQEVDQRASAEDKAEEAPGEQGEQAKFYISASKAVLEAVQQMNKLKADQQTIADLYRSLNKAMDRLVVDCNEAARQRVVERQQLAEWYQLRDPEQPQELTMVRHRLAELLATFDSLEWRTAEVGLAGKAYGSDQTRPYGTTRSLQNFYPS